MGEYAEMMLDGTLCERCGCFIDAEAPEHPRTCDDCFEDELIEAVEQGIQPDGIKFSDWMNLKQKYSPAIEAYRE